MFLDIGWVDWSLLAVLVVSVLVGALRGLIFETLSIVGWVAAYFAAQWAAPLLAPHLPIGAPDSLLNRGAAFAAVFILVLMVWSLLSRLLRSLVHATPLKPIDRLLGAGFGALRGVLLLLALAALVGHTPAAKAAAWRTSIGAQGLAAVLRDIKPMLPPDMAGLLPA